MISARLFQRITSSGIEEIMYSRPYGIQVSNLNKISATDFHFHPCTRLAHRISNFTMRHFPLLFGSYFHNHQIV